MKDEQATSTFAAEARHGHQPSDVKLNVRIAENYFDFEGACFDATALSGFQAWVQAVGPTSGAQAAIDEATRKLRASNDGLASDVATNTLPAA